jgi:hypothetical protein
MSHGQEAGLYKVPQSAVGIRTLRTKIMEALDDVRRAPDDERAINGWRELCSYGLAIIQDVAQRGKLPENNGTVDWKAEVERLQKEWNEMKTSEKTSITTNREGGFTVITFFWDSVVAEVPPELFMQGMAVMDREKYNAICHRLMQFWGSCLSIMMASKELMLDDQVETPIMPDDRYSRDKMKGGMDRWKAEKASDKR